MEPSASHRDGPIFLNVLRVLDVPEALGLLAPSTAPTLVRGDAGRFRPTIELYRTADRASQLRIR